MRTEDKLPFCPGPISLGIAVFIGWLFNRSNAFAKNSQDLTVAFRSQAKVTFLIVPSELPLLRIAVFLLIRPVATFACFLPVEGSKGAFRLIEYGIEGVDLLK